MVKTSARNRCHFLCRFDIETHSFLYFGAKSRLYSEVKRRVFANIWKQSDLCAKSRKIESVFKIKNEMDASLLNIAEFYVGRSIFITGGTGFLGKILIEKLLRSCPGLNEIFLLMRPKKGLSVDERLHKLFTLPLFDKVRETNPSIFEKVIPVNGDTAKEGLGLDSIQRQVLMDRVSIIFHVAASVRFDDSLRDAIFINIRSTRDLCILAGSMKQLAVFVHVSSTYAHADKPVVEEIFYPSDVDWKKTIKIAENIDSDLLKSFTAKYIGSSPNTYIFTKKLAECVMNDYSDRLPCVIVRPSVVVSTMDEPVRGWLDNFHGPTGLMIGGGKGVMRIFYANPDVIVDYIPVDIVIKSMLLVACKRGRITITKDPSLHVYNCSSNKFNDLSMEQMTYLSLSYVEDIPLDSCIWRPNANSTKCFIYYYINVLIFHLLPAIILDAILKLVGYKPILLSLHRKIYIANVAVGYFVLHKWEFLNDKIINLSLQLSKADMDFYFSHKDYQLTEFLKNAFIGAKIYLLREDVNQLEKAKKHLQRMWWIDVICRVFWTVLLVWAFISYGYFSYLCGIIESMFQ